MQTGQVKTNTDPALTSLSYRSCRHAWNILQQQLHRINDEIAVKSNSIMLEQRALDTRRRLNTQLTPSTETDRNQQLFNMDKSGLRPILQSIY